MTTMLKMKAVVCELERGVIPGYVGDERIMEWFYKYAKEVFGDVTAKAVLLSVSKLKAFISCGVCSAFLILCQTGSQSQPLCSSCTIKVVHPG